MKLRKAVCIIGACALTLSMAACAKKAEPAQPQAETPAATQAPAETTTQATTEAAAQPAQEPVGMANPMVEITDPKEFNNQLGISIQVDKLHDPNPKMFIIDGKTAEIQMKDTNPNGEPVEYTLRATKDAGLAPQMHGIFDPLVDLSVKDFEFDGKKITVTEKETKDKKIQVSSWQVGDTYYTLTITNSPSQMQIAEVMDSIWAATGVTKS